MSGDGECRVVPCQSYCVLLLGGGGERGPLQHGHHGPLLQGAGAGADLEGGRGGFLGRIR